MEEPPVFGENGAVLNSDTMTDEWRAEHDKEAQQQATIPIWNIACVCIFIAIIFTMPKQYYGQFGAILGILNIVSAFIPKIREAPMYEKLTLMVFALVPLYADWLQQNGYLGDYERWFWWMISGTFSLSLIVVYYVSKHMMTKRLHT